MAVDGGKRSARRGREGGLLLLFMWLDGFVVCESERLFFLYAT
jgi:hypothetical protein